MVCRRRQVARPTATIAGASSERLPVISATISITASGAWAMPPKSAIIATITKGAGVAGMPGRWPAPSRQKAAPSIPPITMPGPKMPPEPPEPMLSEVARILANGRSEDDPERQGAAVGGSCSTCTQP